MCLVSQISGEEDFVCLFICLFIFGRAVSWSRRRAPHPSLSGENENRGMPAPYLLVLLCLLLDVTDFSGHLLEGVLVVGVLRLQFWREKETT